MLWLRSVRQCSRALVALSDPSAASTPLAFFSNMATAVAEPAVKKAKIEYAHTREVSTPSFEHPWHMLFSRCHPPLLLARGFLKPSRELSPSRLPALPTRSKSIQSSKESFTADQAGLFIMPA